MARTAMRQGWQHGKDSNEAGTAARQGWQVAGQHMLGEVVVAEQHTWLGGRRQTRSHEYRLANKMTSMHWSRYFKHI